MSTSTIHEKRVLCPNCGARAKRVSLSTLHGLLKPEFAGEFVADDQSCRSSNGDGETGCSPVSSDSFWRFCDSRDCDIVYFSEVDDRTFTKSQLRVDVGVKESFGKRPLCYCFGHSIESIKQELRANGDSGALEDIRAKMKDPGCRCETKNPSGSCCLGSVAKGIKTAQDELRMTDPNTAHAPLAVKSSGNKGEKIAKIGTVVSAIMASSCCWLPLVLLAVGVSGAGIASTLEEYRPLFMVVTFGFLAAAFYFTYRPKQATVTGGGHDCCATETAAYC